MKHKIVRSLSNLNDFLNEEFRLESACRFQRQRFINLSFGDKPTDQLGGWCGEILRKQDRWIFDQRVSIATITSAHTADKNSVKNLALPRDNGDFGVRFLYHGI